MPTPAEQKALVFVSIFILLGTAARAVRGGAATPASHGPEQQALARQAFAASSSATAASERKSKSGQKGNKAPRRRYAGAKFDSTGVLIDGTGVRSTTGFPSPGPRIDIGVAGARPAADGRVDLDVADWAQIARLPRVGPALAKRIVADRDSLGPFGALSGLRRVRGVGAATLERLAEHVTFSGQARR